MSDASDNRLAAMDEALGTAAARLLQSIAAINCMRAALRTGDPQAAVDATHRLAQHMSAAQRELMFAATVGKSMIAGKGGLTH